MALTQTGTLADLKSDVIDALQGRTDVSDAAIANYAAKAIREISESNEFDELRSTGPNFALSIGVSTYAVTNFVNTPDVYSMPESFAIYIDTPANTVVAPLRYKTPAAIEPLVAPAVQGIPAWYSRFGANFLIGPVPNNTYTTFLRYQAQHPFSVNSPTALTEKVYMPLSWYDILAYATAERIAVVKRWNDQSQYLHGLLWGDPEFQVTAGKRGRPGLIQARILQQERDQAYNSRSLTPLVARVNPR